MRLFRNLLSERFAVAGVTGTVKLWTLCPAITIPRVCVWIFKVRFWRICLSDTYSYQLLSITNNYEIKNICRQNK
jgi:hypothetical protein